MSEMPASESKSSPTKRMRRSNYPYRNGQLQSGKFSRMMDLPPEICDLIYEYVLTRSSKTIVLSEKTFSVLRNRGPALLRASTVIRKEALPVYFCCNEIRIHVMIHEIPRLAAWIDNLVESYAMSKFRIASFHIDGGQSLLWHLMPLVLPLLQSVAEGRFYLDITSSVRRATIPNYFPSTHTAGIFKIEPSTNADIYQPALETCVLMGEQAKDEQWTADRLIDEFSKLELEIGTRGRWWLNRCERHLAEVEPLGP